MPRFAIGIDLGTTNCALAYVELKGAKAGPRPNVVTFSIPQRVDEAEFGEEPLLPSFVYLPADHETAALAEAPHEWLKGNDAVVGEAARRMGTRVPARLVASAKSWLCHGGVDRRAKILPWQADPTIPRISPLEASSLYLSHLRAAWNARFAASDESLRLEHQRVVLTVPASFDEVARELTVEAAQRAGIEQVTLLEEPQAAFYHWIVDGSKRDGLELGLGDVCVVIDCGGGTTDFSLIGVVEQQGEANYRRLAVGEHLLLGGDNMDLALAHHVEQRISPQRRLDTAQWGSLVQSCRRVKEAMLGDDPPGELKVTVMGRGSAVIGGGLTCTLEAAVVRRLTLDGFFPEVAFEEKPLRSTRAGLQEFGLPFVADAAITRHLAEFLRRHAEAIRAVRSDGSAQPTAVLFNGGVFNAVACRRRVLEVMQRWFGEGWSPAVLDGSQLDLGVARGAAYFGWLKEMGVRGIHGGSARSYYVGVANDTGADPAKQAVLCLVPHGMHEGEAVQLTELPLEVRVGEPVAFPLYTSTVRRRDKAGQVFEISGDELAQLPSLMTVLRGGRRSGPKRIAVQLEARLTEIGTLELWCVSRDGQHRWKLQFQTRLAERDLLSASRALPTPASDTWSEEHVAGAAAEIRTTFHPSARRTPPLADNLPKRLEAALGLSRHQWPTSMLRALWDPLAEVAPHRALTVEHECRWYHLAGFVLRPGWGDPLDAFRVEQLWKLVHQQVVQAKSDRVWSEYWVMCRRVAGGLDPARQNELANRLLPYVLPRGPAGRKPPRRVGSHELAEIWRAIASLEWLDLKLKIELGDTLMRIAERPPLPRYLVWSLTRLGMRVPVYGPANVVVDKATAQRWLAALLELPAVDRAERAEVDFALAQIARRTGDRARDVDEDLRDRVIERLTSDEAPPHWVDAVREPTQLDDAEQDRLLGDAAPPGLRLAAPSA